MDILIAKENFGFQCIQKMRLKSSNPFKKKLHVQPYFENTNYWNFIK